MQRAKRILRELAFVLLKSRFGLGVPYLTLVVGKVLPSETDDLRQSAVICLDLRRNVLAFDERGAEEYEGIRRPWYMVLGFLLTMSRTTRSGAVVGRREEVGFAGDLERRRRIIESHGCYIGSECEALGG